jgi:hypothetical protein
VPAEHELAAAYDLNVFCTVVDKPPAEVTTSGCSDSYRAGLFDFERAAEAGVPVSTWGVEDDDGVAEGLHAYAGLDDDRPCRGEMVVSQALADPSRGKRVSVSGGRW